ncbi:MAG: hypothetical protein ACKPBU_05960 [Alphaproteobacteria bacterium]
MRGRNLTLAAFAATVAAVWLSMRTEERFVVESPRIERTEAGSRVVGSVRNTGAPAGLVKVEVTTVSGAAGHTEKETLELRQVASGETREFASTPKAVELRNFSVYVNEGRNPYGN